VQEEEVGINKHGQEAGQRVMEKGKNSSGVQGREEELKKQGQ